MSVSMAEGVGRGVDELGGLLEELVAALLQRQHRHGLVGRGGVAGLAVDVSKPALRRAAQAHPRAAAIRADLWRRLPVSDGVAALILNVFAPRNGPEYHRVLRPDGLLLVVTHYIKKAFGKRGRGPSARADHRARPDPGGSGQGVPGGRGAGRALHPRVGHAPAPGAAVDRRGDAHADRHDAERPSRPGGGVADRGGTGHRRRPPDRLPPPLTDRLPPRQTAATRLDRFGPPGPSTGTAVRISPRPRQVISTVTFLLTRRDQLLPIRPVCRGRGRGR